MKFKYFTFSEFDSPDEPGSGVNVDPTFIEKLDRMREICGFPFIINSGYRTPEHNKKVKGAKMSAHLISPIDGKSHAADIQCLTSIERYKMIRTALVVGFRRIWIGKTFIHLDNAPESTHVQDAIGVY